MAYFYESRRWKKWEAALSFAQPADSKIFRGRTAADLADTAISEQGRRTGALQTEICGLLLG